VLLVKFVIYQHIIQQAPAVKTSLLNLLHLIFAY